MPDAGTLRLECPLDPDRLAVARDRTEAFLIAAGVDDRLRYKVRLVLEELVANLMRHGRFAGPPPPLRLAVASGVAEVRLVLEDAAAAFDPRGACEPIPAASLADDRLGGLGLPLVRRMAEIRSYDRTPDGWNRTELLIRAA